MATEKDAQIFVSGVTQYSMSSGKFGIEDIPLIAQSAYNAFSAVFGPPTAEAAPPPRPAPGAFQRPQAAPAAPPPVIPPETKPFQMWGGDKAYYGKTTDMMYGFPIREVDWSTWLDQAARGDRKAKQVLEIMAGGNPNSGDPRYFKNNCSKIARAKACLQMLAQGHQAPAEMEGPPEDTPF